MPTAVPLFLVTRDFMTVKIWDMHMERLPVQTIVVDGRLGPSLHELYESDCIFDKFDVTLSSDGSKVVTGCYNNEFKVWSTKDGELLSYVDLALADRAFDNSRLSVALPSGARANYPLSGFDQKILHCNYHPCEGTLSVAGRTGLYLFD